MKSPERLAADLLFRSFLDIEGKYSGLTPSERSLCTKEEFKRLLEWIKKHRTK